MLLAVAPFAVAAHADVAQPASREGPVSATGASQREVRSMPESGGAAYHLPNSGVGPATPPLTGAQRTAGARSDDTDKSAASGDPFADPEGFLTRRNLPLLVGIPAAVAFVLLLAGRHRVAAALRSATRRLAASAVAPASAARAARPTRLLPVAVRRGRAARALSFRLAELRATDVVVRAASAAQRLIAAPDKNGISGTGAVYAAVLRPDSLTLHITAAEPPSPAHPWVADSTGLRWTAALADLTLLPEPKADTRPLFVAIGTVDGGALLVDLHRAPGVVAVDGDWKRSLALVRAIGDQIGWAGAGAAAYTGCTARGMNGPTLARTLRYLQGTGERRFVVCSDPTADELDTLASLTPRVKALIVGASADARWVFKVTEDGDMYAETLGLSGSTLGIDRAVAALPSATAATTAKVVVATVPVAAASTRAAGRAFAGGDRRRDHDVYKPHAESDDRHEPGQTRTAPLPLGRWGTHD